MRVNEKKVWENFSSRLRWDGDALLTKYQPRLFNYFHRQIFINILSTFFAGKYAVNYTRDESYIIY
jgi:hypothetical protein